MRALFLLFLLPMTLLATPDFTPVIEHLKKEVPTEKRDPLIYFLLGLTTPHFDNYSDSDRKQEIHDIIGTGEEGLPYKPIDSAAVSNMTLEEVCSVYIYFAEELMGDAYKVSDQYVPKLFEIAYRSNYEPLQKQFVGSLPKNKDEIRAHNLNVSIDAFNNTRSQKYAMLFDMLAVDGVQFFDTLTIMGFELIENYPQAERSKMLKAMLSDSKEPAAKKALKKFNSLKSGNEVLKGFQCASVLREYILNKNINVSDKREFIWSDSSNSGKGSIDEFLLFLVDKYLGKEITELAEITLQLNSSNKKNSGQSFLQSLEYNHELFYYLVHLTDNSYKPQMPYTPELMIISTGRDAMQVFEEKYSRN